MPSDVSPRNTLTVGSTCTGSPVCSWSMPLTATSLDSGEALLGSCGHDNRDKRTEEVSLVPTIIAALWRLRQERERLQCLLSIILDHTGALAKDSKKLKDLQENLYLLKNPVHKSHYIKCLIFQHLSPPIAISVVMGLQLLSVM